MSAGFEASDIAVTLSLLLMMRAASLPIEVLTLCRAELGPTLDWHDDFHRLGRSLDCDRAANAATSGSRLSRLGQGLTQRDPHRRRHRRAADSDCEDAQASRGVDRRRTSSRIRGALRGQADKRVVLFGFRHFTALQAMAAVLLRVPLLLMAALGLAIIDPEELLLVGDISGFLRATIIAYCVYMVVPFVNLGLGAAVCEAFRRLHVRARQRIAPGRYQKTYPVIICNCGG